MAIFFEETNRLVIPNWRSFSNTAKIGELNGSKKLLVDPTFNPDLTDLIDDWENSKTIGVAADLLGAAIIGNQLSNPEVVKSGKIY